MSDVPNIEVKVVSTDNPPTGAGEDGVPLVASAVGNAIAALTGVRLHELPFAPDRVRGALGLSADLLQRVRHGRVKPGSSRPPRS